MAGKTAYILRTPTHRFVIVWTDDKANMSSTPLASNHAPAHTAFRMGTSDDSIRALAKHPGRESYRSLRDVAEVHMLSEAAVKAARSRGISVERGASLTPGYTAMWSMRFQAVLANKPAPNYTHPEVDVDIDEVCEALDCVVVDVRHDATDDVEVLLSGSRVACIRLTAGNQRCWDVYDISFEGERARLGVASCSA